MLPYTAYHFEVNPLNPGVDILIAELGELGFESFVEEENGVTAYIPSKNSFPEILKNVSILNSPQFQISYTTEEIQPVNWNEEWEKNFQPINIDGICYIRAPFHPKIETRYDIVIEPKMSFGTGHHATTWLMARYILKEDFKEKTVLDMGCGTGVLAILAEKKGAEKLDAIDIDRWCYENTMENVERNDCTKTTVYEGDAKVLKGKQYDIILANINRNILLEDLPIYVQSLNRTGSLFLSGFYVEDLKIIQDKCQNLGLLYESCKVKDNWVAVKFVK
ncbi:MAG TPA: 50S ribosomal protein L11 methyltransferase [Flavobacteriaceae bacterium]|nr:50S ribosomal protein L11 methyltransferase [Flavobacteriaceae bacterium]